MTARCPVCTLVCPAWPSPDPRRPALVRPVAHTSAIAYHEADLLGFRDLLLVCIGSRADVRPYTGTVPAGTYLEELPA